MRNDEKVQHPHPAASSRTLNIMYESYSKGKLLALMLYAFAPELILIYPWCLGE